MTAQNIQVVDETGLPFPDVPVCCTVNGMEIRSDREGRLISIHSSDLASLS